MNCFFKELENGLEVMGKKENILGYLLPLHCFFAIVSTITITSFVTYDDGNL